MTATFGALCLVCALMWHAHAHSSMQGTGFTSRIWHVMCLASTPSGVSLQTMQSIWQGRAQTRCEHRLDLLNLLSSFQLESQSSACFSATCTCLRTCLCKMFLLRLQHLKCRLHHSGSRIAVAWLGQQAHPEAGFSPAACPR